jgi:tRNA nucleotidyltransferase (CCA-adding enzyme)
MENKNEEKEYHEEITEPKELEALEHLKNSLANVTDKKDKAVLDIFVLYNNDFLIRFLRAKNLNIKKLRELFWIIFIGKQK